MLLHVNSERSDVFCFFFFAAIMNLRLLGNLNKFRMFHERTQFLSVVPCLNKWNKLFYPFSFSPGNTGTDFHYRWVVLAKQRQNFVQKEKGYIEVKFDYSKKIP